MTWHFLNKSTLNIMIPIKGVHSALVGNPVTLICLAGNHRDHRGEAAACGAGLRRAGEVFSLPCRGVDLAGHQFPNSTVGKLFYGL